MVYSIPQPVINSDFEICSDEFISIQADVDEYTSFEWIIEESEILIDDENSLTPILWTEDLDFDTLNINVILEVSNNVCTGTANVAVVIYEKILEDELSAGDDIALFDIYSTDLSGTYSGPGEAVWTNSAINPFTVNIETPNQLSTEINGLTINQFEFILTAENGSCEPVQDNVMVSVSDFIPNAFSPDGNGIDDYFVIPGILSNDIRILKVFNTWGSEVYSNDHYENNWDGVNNSGKDLAEGTYYYIVKIGNQEFSDFVIIKRN